VCHNSPVQKGAEPDAADWWQLTRSAVKRRAYAEDLYFRESWPEAVAGLDGTLDSVLHRVTMLAMKPDAIVGRRSRPALNYLLEHGFRPLTARATTLDRHAMREIWRYDWNVYTSDRLNFSSLWYISTPMLFFMLVDSTAGPGTVPASVRLGSLKGLADPARRNPAHLRTRLEPPNRILNFVHVTDEPADLVREVGILWDRPQRLELWSEIGRRLGDGVDPDIDRLIDTVESRCPAHDLDFDRALRRLAEIGLTAAAQTRLRQATQDGNHLGWDELVALLPANAERWDVITVASTVLEYERAGVTGLLPGVTPADWS
jgi:hypothetical protein